MRFSSGYASINQRHCVEYMLVDEAKTRVCASIKSGRYLYTLSLAQYFFQSIDNQYIENRCIIVTC